MLVLKTSARRRLAELRLLHAQSPTSTFTIACRDKKGSFYGGHVYLLEKGKMLIRNWQGKIERVPLRLSWLDFTERKKRTAQKKFRRELSMAA